MNIRLFLTLFVIILTLIFGYVGYLAYIYYQALHADNPADPIVRVDAGQATIIRGKVAIDLTKNETYVLKNEDSIETQGESKATLIWPDRSITRMGENSRIQIHKMHVSTDYKDIEIAYDIKRGKVWNTLIHVLLGESYFEARIPKNNIIAAVRGTIFEINLDDQYIHAVSHDTLLSDPSGKLLLLPGELVSSENIWVKKGREWINQTWSQWNTEADLQYKKARNLLSEKQIDLLSGIDTGLPEFWIRKGLAHLDPFHDLEKWKELREQGESALTSLDKDTLLRYYQRLQSTSFSHMRDSLRTRLLEETKSGTLFENLRRNALWEHIDMPDIDLTSSRSIIEDSLSGTIRDMKNVKKTLEENIPLDDSLKEKIREFLKGE